MPGAPENGVARVGCPRIGATVIYDCNPNYVLVGTDFRTCQRYVRWSGSVPKCECKPINMLG